jgi:hypothetical protein
MRSTCPSRSGDPPLALLRDGIKLYETPGAYGRFLASDLTKLESDSPGLRLMGRAFLKRVAERGLAASPSVRVTSEIIQSRLVQLAERLVVATGPAGDHFHRITGLRHS